MTKKILFTFVGVVSSLALSISPVFAHAVVKPNQVGVGSFQDFSLGVPSEKDAATTNVRLLLPPGLQFISPVVKPGWKVEVKSGPIPAGMKAPVADDGDVATSIPTEIDWSGGSIPSGQKDVFTFSAQVPAQPVELDWKVYQGYSDGTTVSWDQAPDAKQPMTDKGMQDFSKMGPYSKTMVIDDLKTDAKAATQTTQMSPAPSSRRMNFALGLSILAIALSLISLAMQFMKKGE